MTTLKELWDDALLLAAEAGLSTIRQRLAVDALYYPLYLAVRRRLGSRRSSNPHGEHQAVIEELQRRGAIENRAGNRLEALRKARNKARYDYHLRFTREEFLSAQLHAEAVLTLLPGLLD